MKIEDLIMSSLGAVLAEYSYQELFDDILIKKNKAKINFDRSKEHLNDINDPKSTEDYENEFKVLQNSYNELFKKLTDRIYKYNAC